MVKEYTGEHLVIEQKEHGVNEFPIVQVFEISPKNMGYYKLISDDCAEIFVDKKILKVIIKLKKVANIIVVIK